jgi:hypothetical protein
MCLDVHHIKFFVSKIICYMKTTRVFGYCDNVVGEGYIAHIDRLSTEVT